MKALVVGGTGPTGPIIVQGLLDRGYEVTIYHRGAARSLRCIWACEELIENNSMKRAPI